MTGFNLPPGCSARDIPGNRPEDETVEAFYSVAYQEFADLPEELQERIADWAWTMVGISYSEGYNRGCVDSVLPDDEGA